MHGPPRERNLAVIRLSSFGDIILTEPVTRALKKHAPGTHLYFITRNEFAEVPALFHGVDEVIPYDRTGPNDAVSSLGREVAFDAVLDLQNNLRSRRVGRRLNGRRLVRYSRPAVRRFLLVKMPWLWRGDLRHTIDLYADALAALGVELADRVPRISVGQDAAGRAMKRIGAGAGGMPVVALCPGGSSEYKRWPEGSFADLVGALASSGLCPVLVGSEEDGKVVETVAARSKAGPPQALVSRDVREVAALLSLAAVTVTNDSGLMHLAAAVGSRVVAIFGPTSPSLGFAPLGEGHIVLNLGLRCSPCAYHGNRPCRLGRRVCMEDLTPAQVHGAVLRVLGKTSHA
jgi:ADP-heptose:LPS heptosyltransferase